MKKITLLSAALMTAFYATSSIAATPSTEEEKLSYTIGYDLGKSTQISGVELDSAFLVQGMKVGTGKQEPALTEQQMTETLESFKKKLVEKAMEERKTLAENNAKASEDFITEVSKKSGIMKIEDGLYYEVVTKGSGPKPTEEDKVEVHYKGELIDGTEFDSTYSRDETASFRLDQVITGWTKALQEMPTGSKWKIYIAPELAYGEFAPPVIGPNQALTFTVDLIGIEDQEAATN